MDTIMAGSHQMDQEFVFGIWEFFPLQPVTGRIGNFSIRYGDLIIASGGSAVVSWYDYAILCKQAGRM
jgi:hypothetical protein